MRTTTPTQLRSHRYRANTEWPQGVFHTHTQPHSRRWPRDTGTAIHLITHVLLVLRDGRTLRAVMVLAVLDHLDGTERGVAAPITARTGGESERDAVTHGAGGKASHARALTRISETTMGSGTGVSRSVSSTMFLTVTERKATSFSTSKRSSCFDFSRTMVDSARAAWWSRAGRWSKGGPEAHTGGVAVHSHGNVPRPGCA